MINSAINLLKDNEPENGYIGCFSGGKDSVVIKHLAGLAGVKVKWHYHITTIDPPELVQFIKKYHPSVIFDRPKYGNFFNRMVKKGFPTRRGRWCCAEYKEVHSATKTDTLIMGIRAEESVSRRKRWGLTSRHFRSGALVVCPIYEWASDELWQFIKDNNIPYCSLYDEGFKRLGCIGCPMPGKRGRLRDFERWPQYEKKWKVAFEKIWNLRSGTIRDGKEWFGTAYLENWEQMWNWWLYDLPLPDKRQLKLFTDNPPTGEKK